MTTSDARGTNFSIGEEDSPLFFNEWLKRAARSFDLTQEQLAKRASCSVFAIRKIEMGGPPALQAARRAAGKIVEIPPEDQATIIRVAPGELNIERLSSIAPVHAAVIRSTRFHPHR